MDEAAGLSVARMTQYIKPLSSAITHTVSLLKQPQKVMSAESVNISDSGYRQPEKRMAEAVAHSIAKAFTVTINKSISIALADTRVLKIFNALKKMKTAIKSRISILGRS